jgi:hypothetical protein
LNSYWLQLKSLNSSWLTLGRHLAYSTARGSKQNWSSIRLLTPAVTFILYWRS